MRRDLALAKPQAGGLAAAKPEMIMTFFDEEQMVWIELEEAPAAAPAVAE